MAARGFEGYVPEVTLDFFKSSVLPHQPEEIIAKFDGAVASLVDSERDCWKDFLVDSNPKNVEDEITDEEEEDVFVEAALKEKLEKEKSRTAKRKDRLQARNGNDLLLASSLQHVVAERRPKRRNHDISIP